MLRTGGIGGSTLVLSRGAFVGVVKATRRGKPSHSCRLPAAVSPCDSDDSLDSPRLQCLAPRPSGVPTPEADFAVADKRHQQFLAGISSAPHDTPQRVERPRRRRRRAEPAPKPARPDEISTSYLWLAGGIVVGATAMCVLVKVYTELVSWGFAVSRSAAADSAPVVRKPRPGPLRPALRWSDRRPPPVLLDAAAKTEAMRAAVLAAPAPVASPPPRSTPRDAVSPPADVTSDEAASTFTDDFFQSCDYYQPPHSPRGPPTPSDDESSTDGYVLVEGLASPSARSGS